MSDPSKPADEAAQPSVRCLKLTIAYEGTNYVGWQVQAEGDSVQQKIESAVTKITGETARVVASGRTDSGVHAFAQVAHVRLKSPLAINVLRKALDANTPWDISILSVAEAPASFHAIRSAVRKTYRYVFQDGRITDPFSLKHAWRIMRTLNAEAMHRAAERLIGEHDFFSYAAKDFQAITSVRTIESLSVVRTQSKPFGRVVLEVTANGFLHHMVRNIAGTLMEVGLGRRDESSTSEVLAAHDRGAAGMTAPPEGLFLVSVDYQGADVCDGSVEKE